MKDHTHTILKIFLCLVSITITSSSSAKDIALKLNEQTAHEILEKAYCGSDKCGSFEYSGNDETTWTPFFLEFEGLGPVSSSGYFAVNPWTGSVWDLWDCKEISTPESRKAQAGIRKKFTKEELGQYDHLAALKPACMN